MLPWCHAHPAVTAQTEASHNTHTHQCVICPPPLHLPLVSAPANLGGDGGGGRGGYGFTLVATCHPRRRAMEEAAAACAREQAAATALEAKEREMKRLVDAKVGVGRGRGEGGMCGVPWQHLRPGAFCTDLGARCRTRGVAWWDDATCTFLSLMCAHTHTHTMHRLVHHASLHITPLSYTVTHCTSTSPPTVSLQAAPCAHASPP